VRGNLLNLEHNWQAAGSPSDPYLPPPAHLRLVWRDGLPYFEGATAADLESMVCFSEIVADLLSGQQVRLRWNREQWQKSRITAAATTTSFQSSTTLTEVVPAYTLLYVPLSSSSSSSSDLRPRRPRYDHSHLLPVACSAGATVAAPAMNHPPIKVRWPEGGRRGLRNFIALALLAENIGAWSAPQFDTPSAEALAVVTAPWFALANDRAQLEDSYAHGPLKHVAVALAKLDYYLFAPRSVNTV
jgi:hypothetical protein